MAERTYIRPAVDLDAPTAIESTSILGWHDGTIDDDLLGILEANCARDAGAKISTWYCGNPGLALVDGRMVIIPDHVLQEAYYPMLGGHNPKKPIVLGMWDDALRDGDAALRRWLLAELIAA